MLKILQFSALQEAEHVINGGIIGGRELVVIEGKVYGLDGKTLIFTTPAGTVTFSDKVGAGHTLAEVIAEIKAVHAGLQPKFVKKSLWVIETTPTNGVVITGAGTANPVFGFGAVTVTGTVYDVPGGTPPRLISDNFHGKATVDGYYILVEPA